MQWRRIQTNILLLFLHALLAAFGALAYRLHIMDAEPVKPAVFIKDCVIAAFIGIILFIIVDTFHVNTEISLACAGISGWVGPQLLDKISCIVMELAGINRSR